MKVKLAIYISIISIVAILAHAALNMDVVVQNNAINKTAIISNEIDPYDTEYVYVKNRPSTADKKIIKEGVNGLRYTYDGINYISLDDKKNEVVQIGTGDPGEFKGRLTGYGPDCPGCSPVGHVSCTTREGKSHSLTYEGVYYNDKEYGKLRIVAADHMKFPCGTVVYIDNGILPKFPAIVLDTGIAMRNAWRYDGVVWMDVAYMSQKEALTAGATSLNTKFSVQRWGW